MDGYVTNIKTGSETYKVLYRSDRDMKRVELTVRPQGGVTLMRRRKKHQQYVNRVACSRATVLAYTSGVTIVRLPA